MEYAARIRPFLDELGAEVVDVGDCSTSGSPGLRTAALSNAVLQATVPWPPAADGADATG